MNHHFRSHTFGGESTLNGDHFQQQHQHMNSTTSARPIDISDGSSNGIIRIHSDSQQSLDRLFNPPASEVTNVVPLRQRNLPSSFFNPRGSSQAIKMEDQHQQQQMVHHYRNFSSPVFMANQLAPGQTQAQPNLHHRQGSSSESFGYMTIASSSSSINQPQQHCHQAGTIVQQQQTTHQFNNSHCSSSSNSDQYLHNNNSNNSPHNHNNHHNQQQQPPQQAYMQPQTQLVQQQQTYMQPQAQLVQQPVQPAHPQPQVQQQQVVHHYRNYSSPAFMTNQVGQNGGIVQAVTQSQVQAPLPQANMHLRQASSSDSFEYVTQTNGVNAGHHQEPQVQTHYNVNHAQQQQHHHQPHCQQVPDITPQQQPVQFNNQHCSNNIDQNQNYHQHAQPEPAQLVGSTMLARSFMRRPPYGVSSLGQ